MSEDSIGLPATVATMPGWRQRAVLHSTMWRRASADGMVTVLAVQVSMTGSGFYYLVPQETAAVCAVDLAVNMFIRPRIVRAKSSTRKGFFGAKLLVVFLAHICGSDSELSSSNKKIGVKPLADFFWPMLDRRSRTGAQACCGLHVHFYML